MKSITLKRGRYLVEGWGASGGGPVDRKGKGAFITAILNLRVGKTLYITVGGEGESTIPKTNTLRQGGCNGGGNGGIGHEGYASGSGGGGATDIRIDSSFESRIFVVAAGGDSGGYEKLVENAVNGGYGGDEFGGLAAVGSNVPKNWTVKANQTYGFAPGIGQNGNQKFVGGVGGSEGNGGGGAGYYGGFSPQVDGPATDAGGHGGSSFVSDLYFSRYKMFAGKCFFNSPFGINETGHDGNGFLRITHLPYVTCQIIIQKLFIPLFLIQLFHSY